MEKSSIKNEMNFELFKDEKEAQYRLGRIDINFTFLLYPVKLYAIVNPLLKNKFSGELPEAGFYVPVRRERRRCKAESC